MRQRRNSYSVFGGDQGIEFGGDYGIGVQKGFFFFFVCTENICIDFVLVSSPQNDTLLSDIVFDKSMQTFIRLFVLL